MSTLGQMLLDLRRQNIRPKFIYAIPTFQNPTGTTHSRWRAGKAGRWPRSTA
jgi:DNA-binding transcriptional MocR family regulator